MGPSARRAPTGLRLTDEGRVVGKIVSGHDGMLFPARPVLRLGVVVPLVLLVALLVLVWPGAVSAQPLSETREPGKDFKNLSAESNTHPRGIWSNGVTMWVVDSRDSKVYAYDLATGERRSGDDLDALGDARNDDPRGIWSDGATMWVADWIDEKIYAYDMSTGARDEAKEFNTLKAAGNQDPYGIWSDGATMWVTDGTDNKLYAYNMSTKARDPSRDFNNVVADQKTDLKGLWSDGATMWVAVPATSRIIAYDLATRTRDSISDLSSLETAGNSFPEGIWTDGVTMWVADWIKEEIYAYSMARHQVLVSNIDNASTWSFSWTFADIAQEFTTGASPTGYTLTSVELALIRSDLDSLPTFTVDVHAHNNNTLVPGPGAKLATLAAPDLLVTGFNKFTHPGLKLEPNTRYFVAVDVTNPNSVNQTIHIERANSDEEHGLPGWSIAGNRLRRYYSTASPYTSATNPFKLRINGTGVCYAAPISYGEYRGEIIDECPSRFRDRPAYAQHYRFSVTGQHRQTVVFTLESDDFDAFLYIAEGAETISSNDDQSHPRSMNSRLVQVLDPGDYIVEITSYDARDTGDYVLVYGPWGTPPAAVRAPNGGWEIRPPNDSPAHMWVRATPVSDSALDLSWEAINGAQSYIVQWKTHDQAYSDTQRIHYTDATDRSRRHRIEGLSADTPYTVRVTVRRSSGQIGRSGEAQGTTGGPLAVTVDPVAGSETALDVSWPKVKRAYTYNLYWKEDGKEYSNRRSSNSIANTAYRIEGLSPGTTYTVKVVAKRNRGDLTGEGRGTTNSAPRAPAAAAAPADEADDSHQQQGQPDSTPAAYFVIYYNPSAFYDPNAWDASADRYIQGVRLLTDAGIAYSEVTGDVQADVDRLAKVTDSTLPRFFLGDPTAADWVSQPGNNNGDLHWLKQKVAELSGR